MARKTNRDHAAAIEAVAERWARAHLRDFADDPEMVECGRRDAADLKRVAAYMRRGDHASALRAGSNLDTIVRDAIPTAAWKAMGGEVLR